MSEFARISDHSLAILNDEIGVIFRRLKKESPQTVNERGRSEDLRLVKSSNKKKLFEF